MIWIILIAIGIGLVIWGDIAEREYGDINLQTGIGWVCIMVALCVGFCFCATNFNRHAEMVEEYNSISRKYALYKDMDKNINTTGLNLSEMQIKQSMLVAYTQLIDNIRSYNQTLLLYQQRPNMLFWISLNTSRFDDLKTFDTP